MKQPHTEQTIQHTDDQQNTGNHHREGTPDAHGADRLGGTRAGAENVEPTPAGSTDTGADSKKATGKGQSPC